VQIGNIVDEKVPVFKDEEHNLILKTWGEKRNLKITSQPGGGHHHEVLTWINGYDPKRGIQY